MDKKDEKVDLLYGNCWEAQIAGKIAQLDERDKDLVKRFCAQKEAEKVGRNRMLKVLYTLHGWRQFLPDKRWQELTKDDVVAALRRLNSSNYKQNTCVDFVKILKMFFRFVKGTDNNPPETAWIKGGVKKNLQAPYQEPIKEAELKRLIDVCDDTQMRCFTAMLGYGGFRIGELLRVKLKDVIFEAQGVRVNVSGKTGPRSPLLKVAVPYVSAWVALHPSRQDKEAYLFITRGETHRPSRYAVMRKRLRKYAVRAGVKKHNFGWFRVSSISHKLKNGWSLVEASHYHGNSVGVIGKFYLKMSSQDTDAAVLREQGLKQQNCPRCSAVNPSGVDACSSCGFQFNEYDAQKKFALELLVGMLKDPTKRTELLSVLEKEVVQIEQSASSG